MLRNLKPGATVALLVAMAMPAAADVASLTCGEFLAMDDSTQLNIGYQLIVWSRDTGNAAQAGSLAGTLRDKNRDQASRIAQQKCTGQAPGVTVIAAMKGM